MPYKSEQQRAWAHSEAAKQKGFPTAEWDASSEGLELPERAQRKAPRARKPKAESRYRAALGKTRY